MDFYGTYEYQDYQDSYTQNPYGYDGYYNEYDNFQPDGSPPPSPDKDWEDPILQNRSYLDKIQKDIVLEEYKGLNDLNMYLIEVFVSDFEIKYEAADSEPHEDKNSADFYTSVKILHYPFLEIGDNYTKGRRLSFKKEKIDKLPFFTDLLQTIYTDAEPGDLIASDEQNESLNEPRESALESMKDTSAESVKEKRSIMKKDDKGMHQKQTKTFTLEMGKNVLFTMTGLKMLQAIMEHEIRVRVSERVVVNAAENEANDSSKTSSEHLQSSSTGHVSKQDNPKSRKDSKRVSVNSHDATYPISNDVTVSEEGATLGTATVRLSGVYHQAVLEAARPNALPPFHAPASRTEERQPLIDGEGEEIGTVGMSIFMTCLGRAAVNYVGETASQGYKFEETLFLNSEMFEPSKKCEEPQKMNAKLAKYLLRLGPAIPLSRTSTEVLQECFDKNIIQDENAYNAHKNVDCDWLMMARRLQFPSGSEWTVKESIPNVRKEMDHYIHTQWIDLRRICREMREKSVEGDNDEPKEKSLYERLEEVRIPEAHLDGDKNEIKMKSAEEIPKHRKSSSATSRSNPSSLKSNFSRKKTI